MTAGSNTPRFIAINRVRKGKEQEFEDFLRDKAAPAVQRVQPHLADMWEVLRPAHDQGSDGTAAYVFLFYGDAPLEEWDLGGLLTEAYGEEEATRLGEKWLQLLEGEQSIHHLGGLLPMN